MRRAVPWLLLLAALAGSAWWGLAHESCELESSADRRVDRASEDGLEPRTNDYRTASEPLAPRTEPGPAHLVGSGDAVRVIVTDEAGTPVPAAQLRVYANVASHHLLVQTQVSGGEAVFPCPAPSAEVTLIVLQPHAADGTSLNLLPAYRHIRLEPGTDTRVVLRAGREVTGTVRRDVGGPAVGLRVGVMGGNLAGGPATFATTDQRGHFVLRGLPADGVFVCVLRGSGWVLREQEPCGPDVGHLNLTVTEIRDVLIRVVGPDGALLPGVALKIEADPRQSPRGSGLSGLTTNQGTHLVPGLLGDAKLSIEVNPTGLDPPLPRVLAHSEPGDTEVTVRVPPAAYIEGRVTRSDGQPVPGAWVLAAGEADFLNLEEVRTNEDGRFRIGPVASGDYRVTCVIGHVQGQFSPSAVWATAPCRGVRLECEQAVPLRARVVNGSGARLRATWISGLDGKARVDAGPDGLIWVKEVRPAPGLLWVYEVGGTRAAIMEVADPSEAAFDVYLEEAEPIRGILTERDGRLPDFLVLCRGERELDCMERASRDGRFETPPLPDGEYVLKAAHMVQGLTPPFVTARAGARGVVVPGGPDE